jgi:hypothetical protein
MRVPMSRSRTMELFELPDLSLRAPAEIAVAGVLQIHTGHLVEAACSVEAGRQFTGERLVPYKAVLARRSNGLLI